MNQCMSYTAHSASWFDVVFYAQIPCICLVFGTQLTRAEATTTLGLYVGFLA